MMNGLMHILCNLNNTSLNWFIILADGTIKGTVILAIIIPLVKLRNRFRPRTIHLILFLTVISLLAIPLVTQGIAFLNNNLNINPPGMDGSAVLSSNANQSLSQRPEPFIPITPQIHGGTGLVNQLPHWSVWLFLIWVIGMMITLVKLLKENIRVYRLGRNAVQISNNEWLLMLGELKAEIGLDLPVTLKFDPMIPVPVVVGCLKPVILIPESADNWSDERRRVVILHELSHIKRYDNLLQNIVYLVANIYWFNPLIWIALRLLKTSRELACDDQVLETGVLPSTYAAHLLAIIRNLRGVQPEFKTVVAMSTTNTEQRMVNILETKRNNNRPFTKRKFLGMILIALLTVGLCSITSVIGTATVNEQNFDVSMLNHSKETEHFIIHYNDKDSSCISDILSKLEEKHPKICLLGYQSTAKFDIMIYHDLKTFHSAILQPAYPAWTVGYTPTDKVYMASPLYDGPNFSYKMMLFEAVHEFVHAVIFRIPKTGHIPEWLSEGIASYVGGQTYRKLDAIWKNELIPTFDDLEARLGTKGLGYKWSYSIVEFAVNTYGIEKLPLWIKNGGDIQKTFGISKEQFWKNWADSIPKV